MGLEREIAKMVNAHERDSYDSGWEDCKEAILTYLKENGYTIKQISGIITYLDAQ